MSDNVTRAQRLHPCTGGASALPGPLLRPGHLRQPRHRGVQLRRRPGLVGRGVCARSVEALLLAQIMLGNGIVKLETSQRFVPISNYQEWVSTATAATTPSAALVRRTASAASSSTSASAGRDSLLSRTSGEIQSLAQVQIF